MDANRKAELANEISKDMVDKGLLIEAGWLLLKEYWVPSDASDQQINDLKFAFFSGAQHLFGSFMNMLDPGDDPTQDDMDRINKIDAELSKFAEEAYAVLGVER